MTSLHQFPKHLWVGLILGLQLIESHASQNVDISKLIYRVLDESARLFTFHYFTVPKLNGFLSS